MNNYVSVTTDFNSLFNFLYLIYFPKVTFRLMYLNSNKTIGFNSLLNILEFTENQNEL